MTGKGKAWREARVLATGDRVRYLADRSVWIRIRLPAGARASWMPGLVPGFLYPVMNIPFFVPIIDDRTPILCRVGAMPRHGIGASNSIAAIKAGTKPPDSCFRAENPNKNSCFRAEKGGEGRV